MMKLVIKTLVIAGLLITLTPAGWTHPEFSEYSGFLGSYDRMQKYPGFTGIQFETSADEGFRTYPKLMIGEVTVHFHPHAHNIPLTEDQVYELADHFKRHIYQTVADYYEIVDSPGDDVLILRAAITNILPYDYYYRWEWNDVYPGFSLNYATVETDFNHSISGKRILAVVDDRRGKRMDYIRGERSWLHTDDLMELWSELFDDIVRKQNAQFD